MGTRHAELKGKNEKPNSVRLNGVQSDTYMAN